MLFGSRGRIETSLMVIAVATNGRGQNQIWSTRGNPGADLWVPGAPGKRLLSLREGE
jgi:hypothetical protein